MVLCPARRGPLSCREIGSDSSAPSPTWASHGEGLSSSKGSVLTGIVHLEVSRTEVLPVATHNQYRDESPQVPLNGAGGVTGVGGEVTRVRLSFAEM